MNINTNHTFYFIGAGKQFNCVFFKPRFNGTHYIVLLWGGGALFSVADVTRLCH